MIIYLLREPKEKNHDKVEKQNNVWTSEKTLFFNKSNRRKRDKIKILYTKVCYVIFLLAGYSKHNYFKEQEQSGNLNTGWCRWKGTLGNPTFCSNVLTAQESRVSLQLEHMIKGEYKGYTFSCTAWSQWGPNFQMWQMSYHLLFFLILPIVKHI